MQAVLPVICRKMVGHPVEGELRIGYPVAIPANDGSEVRMALQVLIQIIKTKNNIG